MHFERNAAKRVHLHFAEIVGLDDIFETNNGCIDGRVSRAGIRGNLRCGRALVHGGWRSASRMGRSAAAIPLVPCCRLRGLAFGVLLSLLVDLMHEVVELHLLLGSEDRADVRAAVQPDLLSL